MDENHRSHKGVCISRCLSLLCKIRASNGTGILEAYREIGCSSNIGRQQAISGEAGVMVLMTDPIFEAPENTARFQRLAEQHQDAVYRQMVRVCGNREDALDVLQEALLRAYRAIDTLKADAAFRVWLARIARNVCVRLRSREALLPLVSLDSSEEGRVWADTLAVESALPETAAIQQELKEIIHRAIDSLPKNLREVYQLRDVEGLSTEETAAHLRATEAAVKARLHRARAHLRQRLNALFMEDLPAEKR